MAKERESEYIRGVKSGVIFAIFDSYDHILLELRKGGEHDGLFIIPGGKVEKGEKTINAVFREIREEMGVYIQKVTGAGVIEREEKGLINKRHVFVVFPEDYLGQMVRNIELKSVYLWASISKAKKICGHPVTTQALDLIEPLLLKRRENG